MLRPHKHPPLRILLRTSFTTTLIIPAILVLYRNQVCISQTRSSTSSIESFLLVPLPKPQQSLESILSRTSLNGIGRYNLCRMYLDEKDRGKQLPKACLHTLLRILAGHIPTALKDFSAFEHADGDVSSSWNSLVIKTGRFNFSIPTKTAFASEEARLFRINRRFLLNLDLAVARLVKTEIEERDGCLSPGDMEALMTVHSAHGHIPIVISYFESLQALGLATRESYWMVIRACVKHKSVPLALTWYQRLINDLSMKKPGIRIFRTLLQAHVYVQRDLDAAVASLMDHERLTGCAVDLESYTLLFLQMEKEGRHDDIAFLFRRMLAWGLEPDLRAWNVYILSRKNDESFDVDAALAELALRGFTADVGTFYALMEVYAGRNNINRAGTLCQEALNRGFALSTRMWIILVLHLLRTDSDTFRMFYESIQSSTQLANVFSKLNSDPYFHSLFLRNLLRNGDIHAIENVKSIVSSGIYPRRSIYDILLKLLIRHGQFSYATKLFEQMQKSDVLGVRATYHSLLMAQLKNLEFCEDSQTEMTRIIEQVMADMRQNSVAPTTDTFNTILSCLISMPDQSLAFQFLKAFEFQPNIITYTLLLKLVSINVLASDLEKIFTSISSDTPFDCIFFTVLFSVLTTSRNRQLHVTTFVQFSRLFLDLVSHRHLTPDARCFNSLMAGYLKMHQPEHVIPNYILMVSEFCIKPTLHTFAILISAMEAFPLSRHLPVISEFGEHFEIESNPMGLFKAIKLCGLEPDLVVFQVMAKVCCTKRDIDTAKMLIEEMRIAGIDEQSFPFRRVMKLIENHI